MITYSDGTTSIDLPGTAERAAMVVNISGGAYLEGYAHALPALTNIGGGAVLRGYAHALPALTNIGGEAKLRGYAHPLPALAAAWRVPVIPDIDARILSRIEAGGRLEMKSWHTGGTCGTTHCMGGWAVVEAGERGLRMEEEHGTELIAHLLFSVSREDHSVPDFYATNKEALADLMTRVRGSAP